jgi:ubiquinone/menaquinone biosynthesis C-methylase UbiE
MQMTSDNPLLRRAYSLDGDASKTKRVYADWAKTYDQDTRSDFGYVAPGIAASALAERVAPDAAILDAGCGTGLAGEELHRRGVTTIDGIDLSLEMLKVAAEKSVYRRLTEADMTKRLDIADNAYDGVICVGTFTSGHVGPNALDELVRVSKSGAHLIVTVHENVWDKDGYAAYLRGMEERGLIRVNDITDSPYHEKAGYRCRLCVLEAL